MRGVQKVTRQHEGGEVIMVPRGSVVVFGARTESSRGQRVSVKMDVRHVRVEIRAAVVSKCDRWREGGLEVLVAIECSDKQQKLSSMQRHSLWRARCPPAVEDRLRQVAEGRQRLLLLREPGPTAFLVAAPGVHRKPHQVLLNNPHTCSCPVFRRERDLCVHICWALVRKLGLPHNDQRCFQLGLSANDLEALLQRAESSRAQPARPSGDYEEGSSSPRRTPRGTEVSRRPVTPSTTCPICMETLLDVRKPVTHCRRGCGHLVHICCMRVLAAHQLGATALPAGRDANVSCPLCRTNNTLAGIQL
ncbi:E3 ubiquitin-protein ligase Zswim2-like [Schistocerca gregaria]|uniref:E3 ubiquitin-protein ligase Zswim2-like n=1 Tax=Schistocerca gregaria TaxID=7010 RepID=UPI00211DE330|nr:E3 ubiquitin-protein ligase Zswim2-like [Schistocerca gregaria]